MNTTDFASLLQHPQTINATQTNTVKTIVDEFPYFQSARAVYLKGLKNKESFKYNQELKITAAYTTDRSILFDFITSKEFLQNDISQHIKHSTEHLKEIEVKDLEDVSINKSVIIDDALRQALIKYGLKGNIPAIKEIYDRAYGRAPQHVEHGFKGKTKSDEMLETLNDIIGKPEKKAK